VGLQREVAIEVLRETDRPDLRRIAAFRTEAHLSGRMNHPHVVQVHDICNVGGDYLMVREPMLESCADILSQTGPLDESTTLTVIVHIARALAFIDQQGLVHGDVNLDNIQINVDGQYKLASLGSVPRLTKNPLNNQRGSIASSHYLAPELVIGGPIDGKSDLYSLGASAFHLLTGNPMLKNSYKNFEEAHTIPTPAALRAMAPFLTDDFANLVMRLLDADPNKRAGPVSEVVEKAEVMLSRFNGIKEVLPRSTMRHLQQKKRYHAH